MNSEKRGAQRYNCLTDYYYSAKSAGERIDCVLKNISATGACIHTDAPLSVGEPILLHICRSTDAAFKATIVWKRENSYGVTLAVDTPEDLENISRIMTFEQKRAGL